MKKLDKKDMPKLIALVVVAVLVFGFAVWQFMPKTSAGSSPAAGSTPSVATTGTTAAVPAGSETTASQPEAPQPFDVGNVQILTGGKDPFVPNGPAAPALPGQVSAPQQTQPASKPVKVAQREPSLGIPSPGTLPISGGGGGGRPGTPPRFNRLPEAEPQQRRPAPVVAVALPPPPPPTFVVTGVVRGEQEDIVILRDGDERRFVRVGDPVGNGFKVTAVLEDGVEIGSGSRRLILNLGGDCSRAK